jgi:hypothetical protein
MPRKRFTSEQIISKLREAEIRLKPTVEKVDSLARSLRKLQLRGNAFHGVVSHQTLQRRMIRGWSPRRLRHPQFLQPSDGTIEDFRSVSIMRR